MKKIMEDRWLGHKHSKATEICAHVGVKSIGKIRGCFR
jgi:hypothetical protein